MLHIWNIDRGTFAAAGAKGAPNENCLVVILATLSLVAWTRVFIRVLATLSVVLLCLFTSAARADNCSTEYRSNVWFNEYFFGSGGSAPPNFLEIYSTRIDFPARWNNWTIDVYTAKDTKTTYTFTTSNSTACTVANKTWLTQTIPGGLRQQNALVVLKDDNGKYVDAYVFDNNSPPAPWPGSAASSWFSGLSDNITGCPDLATTLTTQSGLSGSRPNQANMLVLNNYGNKDMARSPDGGSVWDLTSNTGAGTTYTQCVSNNANFTKTVDNTMPIPGATVTFTLTMANTDSSSPLTGVTIVDNLPSGLTYLSATASNTSDTVNTANASSGSITWTPAPVAAGTSSKLYIKMQVPSNAVPGTTYTNTAQTTTLGLNQSDYATITVQSAATPSFAFSISPASSTTCTPATLGPKVTITAMSQAGGGGSILSDYNGTAILTATTANAKWYNSSGVALTGNTVTFINGFATLYLTDNVAETFTVSAFDFTTYSSPGNTVTMTGTSSPITFSDNTSALIVTNADTINPGYGAVAGRPHRLKAAMTNCGATSTSITGTYATSIYYVPGLYHPVGADAPKVSTTSSCASPVTLTQSTSGVLINLAYTSGVANFYLCTTDVGQFALNATANGRTGISPNFTVRPFVITASTFKADSATSVSAANFSNPAGTGAFTTAGSGFTGSFQAWRWLLTADGDNDGKPDSSPSITASAIASANPGTTASFSGTTNNAGVISIAPNMVAPIYNSDPLIGPVTTKGIMSPTSLTLSSGGTTQSLTYSEVGTISIAGGDATSSFAVTNYLGATNVNTPILSDQIGRFTPNHFAIGTPTLTPRSDFPVSTNPKCANSVFTYMGEPFILTVPLTAKNKNGVTTNNYIDTFAFLNPTTDHAKDLGKNYFGLGAVSGTPLNDRLNVNSLTFEPWKNGTSSYTAEVTLGRATNGNKDGPYNAASIGIAPMDSDGVTVSNSSKDLDADGDGTKERVLVANHTFLFGRLKLFNTFSPNRANGSIPVQVQYWTGRSWLANSNDNCTAIAATAIRASNYVDHKGSATTAWAVTPGGITLSNGQGSIPLAKLPIAESGSVNVCVDLGNDPGGGTACAATTSAGMNYLQGRWPPGGNYNNDPSSQASFGIYSSKEAQHTIHVRELY